MSIEKYIFIITYGRSGSTILMKVLNSIKDSDIKGENCNSLFPLFQSYKYSQQSKKNLSKNSHMVDNPWYGVNDIKPYRYMRELVKIFTREILNPRKSSRVTGFKEIRYISMSIAEREEFIEFLRKAFPNTYIVFNRRNLEDVAKSGWWKEKPYEEVISKLKPLDEWMVKYHKEHTDYTYIVNYDNYNDNPKYFKDLFNWLGEDFELEIIENIMSKKLTHLKGK